MVTFKPLLAVIQKISTYTPEKLSAAIKSFRLVAVLLITGMLAAGCGNSPTQQDTNTLEVQDMLGRKVMVPGQIEKVVGIGPGALRLLVYMQVTDKVVGVEEIERRTGRPYIFAHPELQKLPVIGPPFTGDPELIAASDPDVIFKTYTTRGEADELQKKTGIPVIALRYVNPTSSWRILDSALHLMGNVLHKTQRARQLCGYHRTLTNTLEKKTSDIREKDKPMVYLGGLSHRGTHGINSTSPYYESFVFVNARNIARPLQKNYANNEGVMIDMEQLMVWNPPVIFIDLAGKALVEKDLQQHRQFFRKMEAFKEQQVYGIHPYNWYSTNYSTVLANAWYIGNILYPNRFNEVNPVEKAHEIYRRFLGKSVYEELKAEYGGYGRLSFPSLQPKSTPN